MAHTLSLQFDCNENDDEIEQEICIKLREIFINAVSLLDYNANHALVSDIRKE
jgi:hypothetical protein